MNLKINASHRKKKSMLPAIQGGKPIRDVFLPIGRPSIGQEEIRAVVDTLGSDWISKGPKTKQFEGNFSEYVGTKHALAVASCTAALHVALRAMGIHHGHEVITTPMTFVATANAICYTGATPVFVDVQRKTFNMDPLKIEEKITPRTKAILPVHFAGHPCDMDAILEIARRHGLYVLEDAAHALGAEYKGRKIGSIGDATAYSFYATKNITTGDGGMLVTDQRELCEKAEVYSFHGLSQDAWKRFGPGAKARYDMDDLGYKYNMTDIQAAMGMCQLTKIDDFVLARNRLATEYNKALEDVSAVIPQEIMNTVYHAHHLYPVLLNNHEIGISRDDFVQALKAENIGAGIHYTAVHEYTYYKKTLGDLSSDLPTATYISENIFSLPLFVGMNEKDIDDVVTAIKKLVENYAK